MPIQVERIQILNDSPCTAGDYVLYWMQASQRTRFNHALEYAVERANQLGLPVVACFGLMDDYPDANLRHYAFMLEGLKDVASALRRRGIKFIVRHGEPPEVALHFAADAALVVCDRGYLRHQKRWRDRVADGAGRQVVQVESDVVVPVETVSDHHEFAARTTRPKIHRCWETFLVDLPEIPVRRKSLAMKIAGDIDVQDVNAALAKLKIDRTVNRSPRFTGGQIAARRVLEKFLDHKLSGYAQERNEPSLQSTSTMSAYLHFGQISPVEIALAVRGSKDVARENRDSYLEELIVRRELAMNFAQFNANYDSFDGLPAWAKKTLAQHESDPRPFNYSLEQLELSRTHDPYWNAAQREMRVTGFMHNYMRMYWGKKILEWTASPREAFQTVLHLNNKYFLCGRDPNSYANVGWILGLHDRPWGPARPIFGTVRYMNAAGLERKFDMQAYVDWVASL